MTSQPTASPPAAPAPGFWNRLVGVFVSPRQTFEAVAARPTWVAPLLLVTVLAGSANFVFLSTQAGQQALADNIDERMQGSGRQLTDQQLDRILAISKWTGTATAVAGVVVVTLIAAGLVVVVFGAIQGGSATFRQVFAMVAHVNLISVAQVLVVFPINYVRGSLHGATNLAVLFPFLDDRGLSAKLLGSVDLFLVWIVAVLSIGVGVTYRRPTRGAAVVLFGIYGVLAVIIALVRQYAFGGA